MFSRKKKRLLVLATWILATGGYSALAADSGIATIDKASLPVVDASAQKQNVSASGQVGLVSPSKPEVRDVQNGANAISSEGGIAGLPAGDSPKNQGGTEKPQVSSQSDFDFDLKMKSLNNSGAENPQAQAPVQAQPKSAINDEDLPKEIQYNVNTVENLGNSILSQMDSDLFAQMSEIEKSTTLLTLELRREKIRNEIEAQKAIRQKNYDELERRKAEDKLRDLEKQKQIEAKVLQEKQVLLDKEKLFEVLKQRKLLNAYMNQMLLNKQEWLKEKENLYAQLAAAEQEKKELIALFKERIDRVLEASAKNIQTAETAKANFERIVKGLKARNEQLRKRIEADAKIIKNAKSSMFLQSKSIEELKDRNAAAGLTALANANATATIESLSPDEEMPEVAPAKLSSQYAILGISGRAGVMSVDVIDVDGQALSLKVGSPLPSGHIVSEIGSDYAKFTRDGNDDYLYVGKTIDGIVPSLDAMQGNKR